MNDRKYKYTDDQLDKFIQFKEQVAHKIKDIQLLKNLEDNIYCRFLECFDFNFDPALDKIA